MLKIIVIAFLLSTSGVQAKVNKPCPDEEQMLMEKNLDLDTRSLKGWVRILNNRMKMDTYSIRLSRAETKALIKCITDELEARRQAGKLR